MLRTHGIANELWGLNSVHRTGFIPRGDQGWGVCTCLECVNLGRHVSRLLRQSQLCLSVRSVWLAIYMSAYMICTPSPSEFKETMLEEQGTRWPRLQTVWFHRSS